MTDEIIETNAAEETSNPDTETHQDEVAARNMMLSQQLKLADIDMLVQAVDLALERGAYKNWTEINMIGQSRDRAHAVLEEARAVAAKQEKDKADAESNASGIITDAPDLPVNDGTATN